MADPNIELQETDMRRDSAVIEKGKLFKHDIDADEGMKAMAGSSENIIIDEETNRRLLRKIDWNLMPVCSAFSAAGDIVAYKMASSCALFTA